MKPSHSGRDGGVVGGEAFQGGSQIPGRIWEKREVSQQFRLRKGNTCMKAEPKRAKKMEVEPWAWSGNEPLGSPASSLTCIPPVAPLAYAMADLGLCAFLLALTDVVGH